MPIYKVVGGERVEMTPEEEAAFEADRALTRTQLGQGAMITPIDFANRFTVAEHAAVLASPDPVVKVFHDKLHLAPAIDLESPIVIAGINYYVTAGILTQDRPAVILDPTL